MTGSGERPTFASHRAALGLSDGPPDGPHGPVAVEKLAARLFSDDEPPELVLYNTLVAKPKHRIQSFGMGVYNSGVGSEYGYIFVYQMDTPSTTVELQPAPYRVPEVLVSILGSTNGRQIYSDRRTIPVVVDGAERGARAGERAAPSGPSAGGREIDPAMAPAGRRFLAGGELVARLRAMPPGSHGPARLEHVRALHSMAGPQSWLEVDFTLQASPKHVIEHFGMAVFDHHGSRYGYAVFSDVGSPSIRVAFQPAPYLPTKTDVQLAVLGYASGEFYCDRRVVAVTDEH